MLADDLMRLLVEHQLALVIDGLLIAILVWRWTAPRFPGFVADEMRLPLLTALIAGLPGPLGEYILFWFWPWFRD